MFIFEHILLALKGMLTVLIPEMNDGQLIHLIRSKYLIDAKGLQKTKGIPFSANEIIEATKSYTNA